MTAEEIKKAAKAFIQKDNFIEGTPPWIYPFDAYIVGAETVNEQQPYTANDMKAFALWFAIHVDGKIPDKELYYFSEYINEYPIPTHSQSIKTMDEILEIWRNRNE